MGTKIISGGGTTVAMETAIAAVETAVAAVEADVVLATAAIAEVEADVVLATSATAGVETAVTAPVISTWIVDSNYGSNYTYELGTAGAGKVYWITIGCRYNTRQLSYLRDNGTNIWGITHEQVQHKAYHVAFDPPIPFTAQLQMNICASGYATIGYKMDA